MIFTIWGHLIGALNERVFVSHLKVIKPYTCMDMSHIFRLFKYKYCIMEPSDTSLDVNSRHKQKIE